MIPEGQRNKLKLDTDCPACDWMKDWSERVGAEMGIFMQSYIPHRFQHSVEELSLTVKALTEQLKRMNDMSVAEVDSLKKLLK